MTSAKRVMSNDPAIGGGTGLCGMLSLGFMTAAFTGTVTGVALGVYHGVSLSTVFATIVAAVVGGWIGLGVVCGVVGLQNYRAEQSVEKRHCLNDCCELAVERMRRELPFNRLTDATMEELNWRVIIALFRRNAEEQQRALKAIGSNPRTILSQAFLNRFSSEVLRAVQRISLTNQGGQDSTAHKREADLACRAALDALTSGFSSKSMKDYVHTFSELLIASHYYTRSIEGGGSCYEASVEGCYAEELRDLFNRTAEKRSACGNPPFEFTAAHLKHDQALLDLLLHLQLLAGVFGSSDTAKPYIELKAAITQGILSLSSNDHEDSRIAAMLRDMDATIDPIVSRMRTGNRRVLNMPVGFEVNKYAVDIIREASKLRMIETLVIYLRSRNSRRLAC